jgi:hypothetical protein
MPHKASLSGHSTGTSSRPDLDVVRAEYDVGRDLRLDACRGIALWFVFLDHIPNNIYSWLTPSHYGFSDTTEVFMFISGVTCALAYGSVRRSCGWRAVVSHTVRRSWDIYVAFIALIIAIVVGVYWLGDVQLADQMNVHILLRDPGAALAHAAILQYRPVNTDVLPTFVLFHLLFAPLLWALFRAPNATLGASFLLYVLTHAFGWNLPQWPINTWYFNPFAWQFLVVLGAWWMLDGRKRLGWLVGSRPFVVLAASYVLIALLVALSWSVTSLDILIPSSVTKYIYPIDKSDLDPLRLVHFLAIAVLVAHFVPEDRLDLSNPVLRGAIRCGENSLEIYCLGVLMALGAQILLADVSNGVVMQSIVSACGIVLLVMFATWSTWIGQASGQQPKLF